MPFGLLIRLLSTGIAIITKARHAAAETIFTHNAALFFLRFYIRELYNVGIVYPPIAFISNFLFIL